MPEEQVTRMPLDVESIYRAHARAVYGFIYGRVGSREAAEDITSEVFMKALSHLDPTRDERSSVAWLYRVARNATADYWRGVQSAPVIALDEARAWRVPRPTADALRQEQSAARAALVLSRLPDNYRSVLSCRLLQGLSVAETAAKMGTSEGNVKVLQHRALKRAAELREEAP